MNLTREVKSELLSTHLGQTKSQIEAEFYGLILQGGNFRQYLKDKGNYIVLFRTRSEELATRYSLIVNKLFNKTVNIQKGVSFYILSFESTKEEMASLSSHLSYRYKNDVEESKAYLKGMFLASGQLFVPDETRSSFRVEIPFKSSILLQDVINLLSVFDISVNVSTRNDYPILLIESGEKVSDFLVFIGAQKTMLKVQEQIVNRSMNNMVNRQTNCINANIDRSVKASIEQVNAIKKIQKTVGLNSLSEKLREAAQLRLTNEGLSIEQLSQLTSEPTTKSGFNHRIRKLMQIAEGIEENEKEM